MSDETNFCKSCGKPFVDHLGVQGLCAENCRLTECLDKISNEEIMLERPIQKLQVENARLLDALENLARQHCYKHQCTKDYNGQVAGTTVTDSGGVSSDGIALETLAEAKRFRIVAQCGRMVVGYWPEHDPALKGERK